MRTDRAAYGRDLGSSPNDSRRSGVAPRHRLVLVYPLFAPEAEELLRERGSELVRLPDGRPETIAASLRDADAVILYPPARITEEMIREAPKLRVIGSFGAGTDNIDVAAAERAGVRVLNNAGVGSETMVEWTIAAAIACHRFMVPMHNRMAAGSLDWSKRSEVPLGRDLRGSTFGVVGLGYIGRRVAEVISTAFGATVIAFSRRVRAADVPAGVSLVNDLDDLCTASDTVSVHCALDDTTRGLIGASQIERIGSDGVLVSCARGGVVVEADLVRALRQGALKAAALDVFDPEPPSTASLPLLAETPNLLMTPHIGGWTEAHLRELSFGIAERVSQALEY
ncbi:MAG: D-3-phosphoglycerate dehydrogenase / 2-oxoglutarate reductase [Acidimicrobiaceae bacterium]|jgi:phosphoglycerate dehydrogenase-like enzyme|nr:D-3-phosphoglycerate dehydrogenase / 2-oxoglutarate reductase [Acidimicrobiaceae bacterium]